MQAPKKDQCLNIFWQCDKLSSMINGTPTPSPPFLRDVISGTQLINRFTITNNKFKENKFTYA